MVTINPALSQPQEVDQPLNMTGLDSLTRPVYPVSSFNSLTAASSAVSPASTKPAGTSIVTFSTGGLNCFCRRISGPVAYFSHHLPSTQLDVRYTSRLLQNRNNSYAVDIRAFRSCWAFGMFPCSLFAEGILVGGSCGGMSASCSYSLVAWKLGGHSYKMSLVHFAFSPVCRGEFG